MADLFQYDLSAPIEPAVIPPAASVVMTMVIKSMQKYGTYKCNQFAPLVEPVMAQARKSIRDTAIHACDLVYKLIPEDQR